MNRAALVVAGCLVLAAPSLRASGYESDPEPADPTIRRDYYRNTRPDAGRAIAQGGLGAALFGCGWYSLKMGFGDGVWRWPAQWCNPWDTWRPSAASSDPAPAPPAANPEPSGISVEVIR